MVVKSTRPERMAENLAARDFTLDADAMAALSALNRNRRFNDPGPSQKRPSAPFIPSMIEPTFPPMVEAPAALATLDDACEWLGQHRGALLGALAQEGLLLRGFPLRSAEDFDAFSGLSEFTPFTYQESLSNAVRINKTPRVFTANEAPPEVSILLHHEMAQTPFPPEKLFFFCRSAAEQGRRLVGPMCSIAVWVKSIRSAAAFEAGAGVRHTTRMPGQNEAASGQGRSWGARFGADSRAEAEQRSEDLGYDYQWLGTMLFSPRPPCCRPWAPCPMGEKRFLIR